MPPRLPAVAAGGEITTGGVEEGKGGREMRGGSKWGKWRQR